MYSEPIDLVRHFREMSDEEFVARTASGFLTAPAQALAVEESKSRGIELAEVVVTADDDSGYQGDFQTVGRFLDPTDAHVLRGLLESAGVPVVVADANLVQTNSLWAIAVGGVRVLVPASRAAEAREIIAAFDRGDLALPDDDASLPF